jgi:glucan biosynthesis protein
MTEEDENMWKKTKYKVKLIWLRRYLDKVVKIYKVDHMKERNRSYTREIASKGHQRSCRRVSDLGMTCGG